MAGGKLVHYVEDLGVIARSEMTSTPAVTVRSHSRHIRLCSSQLGKISHEPIVGFGSSTRVE